MNRTLILLLLILAAPAAGQVVELTIEGPIGPIAAEYLESSLAAAEREGAACVVVVLDTPGGLDTAMRDMVRAIMASPVPVAVHVAPDGARAASAGVFLLAAAHVAAMAPATNTGAAHPVNMGGAMDSTMAEKVTNDAVAYLESVASRRGRLGPWCEDMVRRSASVTADSALALGMIDVVVRDTPSLLAWCDGRSVETVDGPATLSVDGAEIRRRDMSARQRLLRQITNPNVAYILMMLGVYGLFFELSRPGAILPGVIGGISLLLAVVAFQALPVNTAGLLLILLGMILLLLEVKIASHGVLGIGGVAALLLGSLMLFKSGSYLGDLSLRVILPVVLCTSALLLVVAGLGLRAQRRPVTTGAEGLVGVTGTVTRTADGEPRAEGTAEIFGELWSFRADRPVSPGDHVRVQAREGRTAVVVAVDDDANDA